MAILNIEIPDELAALVTEALRATYPDVTADAVTDAQAMRAVIGWWTGNLLAEYQAAQARAATAPAIAAAQAQAQAAVDQARAAAWAAIQQALAAETTPTDPTPEAP